MKRDSSRARKGAPKGAPAKSGRAKNASRAIVGTLMCHRHGFGFVRPIGGGSDRSDDLFLPESEARRAMDGDLVRVELLPGKGERGRKVAKLLEVVERKRVRALGILKQRGSTAFVEPIDPTLAGPIQVLPTSLAADGAFVKVELTGVSDRPRGVVIESMGERGEPSSEVLEVAYHQGFSDAFGSEVLAEATALPAAISEQERGRRRDLRALELVTIDGEDSRDFDDAVYVESSERGFRLLVAIADVAHYVEEGSALDREALRRATSVYFPNTVLPMLPEQLSNELCSLKPSEDRLCMVADLAFRKSGDGVELVDGDLYEGVMRSAARCTYGQIAALLGGARVPELERLRHRIAPMEELARRLGANRLQRGAIDLDLPETRVVLDERQRPVALERRARTIAHRLIEEFMLAANEAVARYFSARGLPTVYRVHDSPDEERLAAFLAMAQRQGFQLGRGENSTGAELNALLKKIAGSPGERALNFLMLRSMMQAVYSPENIGHFGLAAPHYLHFTSPIRRYPDLMVHRLLKRHWARAGRTLSPSEREREEELLIGVSDRSSERERAALAADREVAAYFAALFMREREGKVFEGSVAAIADFGLFIELKEHPVEGLVKAEKSAAIARLDPELQRVHLQNGQLLELGQSVRVRVLHASVRRRQIDLELVQSPLPVSAPGGKGRAVRRRVVRA